MPPQPALAAHGALARGVFAVVVLVSLAVLFAPASDVPSAPAGVDKVVHLALFAALASSGRWAGVGARVLAALLLGYAAVSEVVQGLSALDRSMCPGRLGRRCARCAGGAGAVEPGRATDVGAALNGGAVLRFGGPAGNLAA